MRKIAIRSVIISIIATSWSVGMSAQAAPRAQGTARPAAQQAAPCRGVPRLALSRQIDRAFAPHLGALQRVFAQAYCTHTAYFRAQGLGRIPNFQSRPVIYLVNMPEANQLGFYTGDINNDRDNPVLDLMEFRFINSDGRIELPSVQEIQEAMFCKAVDWSLLSDGRCLPD